MAGASFPPAHPGALCSPSGASANACDAPASRRARLLPERKHKALKSINNFPGGLLEDLKTGLGCLTRVPVPAGSGNLARSVWTFPIIGAAVGLAGAGVYGLAWMLGLPPWISSVLAVAGLVLVTGVFHEDGLADVADGFGGGRDRQAKLDIMRDSRLGAYGAAALFFFLALRIGAVAALSAPAAVAVGLFVSGAFSRAMSAAVMRLIPPARKDGLGASAGRPGVVVTGVCLLLAAGISVAAYGPVMGGVVIGAGAAGAAVMAVLALRQIGGHTGDVLGAVQQVSEVAVLLALAGQVPA